MDKEEREMLREFIRTYDEHKKSLENVLKWLLMAFVAVCICFTVCSVTMAVQHAYEVTQISNDYFYSDYDYGTIEQSVDVRNGVE